MTATRTPSGISSTCRVILMELLSPLDVHHLIGLLSSEGNNLDQRSNSNLVKTIERNKTVLSLFRIVRFRLTVAPKRRAQSKDNCRCWMVLPAVS